MPNGLSRATPSPDPADPNASTAKACTSPNAKSNTKADAFLCERCSAEMFRMHAVWRCPSCGFKTDCCGW